MVGVGADPHDLPMADHADQEHRRRQEDHLLPIGHPVAESDPLEAVAEEVEEAVAGHGHDRRQHEERRRAPQIPSLVVEADDEGEEVEAQRDDPQEGDRRHVLAHVVRCGQEHHRGPGGKEDPGDRVEPGDAAAGVGRAGLPGAVGLGTVPEGEIGDRGAGDGEHGEGDPPDEGLRPHAPDGLEEERIGEEGGERAHVGEGVEPVGRLSGEHPAKPGLHERTGRCQHEVGEADGE